MRSQSLKLKILQYNQDKYTNIISSFWTKLPSSKLYHARKSTWLQDRLLQVHQILKLFQVHQILHSPLDAPLILHQNLYIHWLVSKSLQQQKKRRKKKHQYCTFQQIMQKWGNNNQNMSLNKNHSDVKKISYWLDSLNSSRDCMCKIC